MTEVPRATPGIEAAACDKLRSIAFYLPQFHPVQENDEWWEPGFTEWHNVTRAQPRFRGHYQPHLPQDLGFYDLRLPDTRTRQAELAREYGVTGFCYYHYGFNGRRLLETPFEEVRRLGEPDFPFMLCWANENWTRRWDGADHEVLLSQNYDESDDLAHIRHLAEVFADPRYLRRAGRPIFLVYHAAAIPDPRRTTDTWRSEYARLGWATSISAGWSPMVSTGATPGPLGSTPLWNSNRMSSLTRRRSPPRERFGPFGGCCDLAVAIDTIASIPTLGW